VDLTRLLRSNHTTPVSNPHLNSQPVILEILDVLRRPELTWKSRSLQGMDVARIIEILGQAEIVEVSGMPAVSRDEKDDKFLTTARAARAEYLITEDEDLLVIGECEGVKIIDTATFLKILE
jgi:putative PIN family toxin of toxin-antitoxin system